MEWGQEHLGRSSCSGCYFECWCCRRDVLHSGIVIAFSFPSRTPAVEEAEMADQHADVEIPKFSDLPLDKNGPHHNAWGL